MEITHNGYNVFYDFITGKLDDYKNEQILRQSIIIHHIESDKCEIPSLKNKPQSIFIVDVTKKENDWIETCTCNYYELIKMELRH